MVIIDDLVMEWKAKVETVERHVFEPLLGKFLINRDERATALFYISSVSYDGLHTVRIEKDGNFIKFYTSVLGFENVKDYNIAVNLHVIKNMSKNLFVLFKTLIDLKDVL